MFLRSEARQFKEKAKLFMPPRKIDPLTFIKLVFVVKGGFYYKNGKPKKLDLQNHEKILIDAIAEKYGFEDSMGWGKECHKGHSDKEEVIVEILRCRINDITIKTKAVG